MKLSVFAFIAVLVLLALFSEAIWAVVSTIIGVIVLAYCILFVIGALLTIFTAIFADKSSNEYCWN